MEGTAEKLTAVVTRQKIDKEGTADDQQAEELPGLFNIGFVGLHRPGNVLHPVFCNPVPHTIFSKEKKHGINQVKTN